MKNDTQADHFCFVMGRHLFQIARREDQFVGIRDGRVMIKSPVRAEVARSLIVATRQERTRDEVWCLDR